MGQRGALVPLVFSLIGEVLNVLGNYFILSMHFSYEAED
jgi:hypothetical protein